MVVLEANDQLKSDHIGFHDKIYRDRRNFIVEQSKNYTLGDPFPIISYTDLEKETWKSVFTKLFPLHQQFACREYNQNIQILIHNQIFTNDKIPDLQVVSNFLHQHTGFTLYPVSGLLSPRQFLQGLAEKRFYCTQYIRHHSNPYYTPEPDIIHEMLGHVPMFLDPNICLFSERLGKMALTCSDAEISELEKIYWFSVEFGLVGDKIYGAGILSSIGEVEKISSGKVDIVDFNISEIIKDQPLITQMQERYYRIQSLTQLNFQDIFLS